MGFRIGFWNATYAHDRRAHRHRCRCCGKVLQAGDAAIMARVGDRKTWAIHEACGETRHSPEYTWAEVMKVWAFQHQLKCQGISETNPRQYAAVEKYRLAAGVPAYA